MKKIGIILDYYYNVTILSLVEQLNKDCKREGYQLIVFEGRPFDILEKVIIGYHSVYSIIQTKSLDGLILVSHTITNPNNIERVNNFLVKLDIPVVTIGRKIGNFPVVQTDNISGIAEAFHHLYHKHNKRKIAFVSGDLRQTDGLERYEQYIKVLQEHNLKINEDVIFYGAFMKKSGYDAAIKFSDKIRAKEIDSIIFSNDGMAKGAMDAFMTLGIQCPKDVAITGYDNISWAALCEPPLTTVSQNYEEMADRVFSLLQQCMLQNPVNEITYIPSTLVIRKSCGCENTQPQFANEGLTGIDVDGTLFSEQIQTYEMKLLLSRLKEALVYNGILDFVMVSYPKPLFFESFDTLQLPDSSSISFALIDGEQVEIEKEFVSSKLLPDSLIEKMNTNALIIKPIFFANEIYGYCAAPCSASKDRMLSEVRLYLSDHIKGARLLQEHIDMETRLNNTLEELKIVNSRLSILSNRDELTGLYNRRGFFLESSTYLKADMKDNYLIIYIDMDNLKNINDNFGHEEGDIAINMVATLLSESVREGDIVCRQSGDEFIVFIKEAKKEMISFFEKRFTEKIEKLNQDSKKPYKVDFSWGFVYANRCNNLDECLRDADEKMMQSKKEKKAKAQAN